MGHVLTSHRVQAVVSAVLLALACAACGFVQRATHDGFDVSYDELTAMIADVEARRVAHAPFRTWVKEQGTLRNRCDHVRVSNDELVRAAADLQRARELGITDARVDGTGYWGWPYPHNTHLDVLGYDADWLQRHAR
jgi:hypothetical protein